jgi:hypothetical protein
MITEPVVRTARGTVIERYARTGVGKRVGSKLYFHYAYVSNVAAVFPKFLDRWALANVAFRRFTNWKFSCVRLDLKTMDVRFDEAPDFDTAREPHVGRTFTFFNTGHHAEGHSNALFHHRWLWVRPTYVPFDPAESRRWSAKYSSLIASAPSGSARVFARQLAEAGLE